MPRRTPRARRFSAALLGTSVLGGLLLSANVACADEGVVDQHKRFTVGPQLLSAALTQRFGVESTIRVAEHHAIVFVPYGVYFTTLDYLAILRGDRTVTKDKVQGEGVEFGYRYRTSPVAHSQLGVARFYGDARLIASQFTLRHTDTDPQGNAFTSLAVPYSRRGFAFEFGAEATVAPIFYFALTGGFDYAFTSHAFAGAQKLAATSAIYGEGFRPRIGGATGFTF